MEFKHENDFVIDSVYMFDMQFFTGTYLLMNRFFHEMCLRLFPFLGLWTVTFTIQQQHYQYNTLYQCVCE